MYRDLRLLLVNNNFENKFFCARAGSFENTCRYYLFFSSIPIVTWFSFLCCTSISPGASRKMLIIRRENPDKFNNNAEKRVGEAFPFINQGKEDEIFILIENNKKCSDVLIKVLFEVIPPNNAIMPWACEYFFSYLDVLGKSGFFKASWKEFLARELGAQPTNIPGKARPRGISKKAYTSERRRIFRK